MTLFLLVRRRGHRPLQIRIPGVLTWSLLLLFVAPLVEILALRALFLPGRRQWREAVLPLRMLEVIGKARGLSIHVVDGAREFRFTLSD